MLNMQLVDRGCDGELWRGKSPGPGLIGLEVGYICYGMALASYIIRT